MNTKNISSENDTNKSILGGVGCWVSIIDSKIFPDENETVWLYNSKDKFVALGCHVWTGEEGSWCWALSNGSIYADNDKIVSECDVDDDYEFTHWCRLPVLPLT